MSVLDALEWLWLQKSLNIHFRRQAAGLKETGWRQRSWIWSFMCPKSQCHVSYPQGVLHGWDPGEDVCRKRWSLKRGLFYLTFFCHAMLWSTESHSEHSPEKDHKGCVEFGSTVQRELGGWVKGGGGERYGSEKQHLKDPQTSQHHKSSWIHVSFLYVRPSVWYKMWNIMFL